MTTKAKQTTVFGAGRGTVEDVLEDVLANESTPTAAAAGVEGKANEPVYVPAPGSAGAPALSPGGPAGLGPAGAGLDSAAVLSPAEGADQTFALIVTLGRLVGDEEWEPDDPDEEANVKRALERVYAIRGVPSLPPELGLAIVLGRYAQKRVSRPKTKSKVRAWFGSIKLPFRIAGSSAPGAQPATAGGGALPAAED